MGESAKLIFEYPVMIDGFALNSSSIPAKHFALLDEVAETVNALYFFDDGGMVFLWGETDLSGETDFNNTLGGKRAEAVAAYLRLAECHPGSSRRFLWGRRWRRELRGRMPEAGGWRYGFRSLPRTNRHSR